MVRRRGCWEGGEGPAEKPENQERGWNVPEAGGVNTCVNAAERTSRGRTEE